MSRIVTPRKKAPAGCLIPFGLIFLLAGLAVCWVAWTQLLAKVAEVRKWTETPCRVVRWEAGIDPNQGEVYKTIPQIAYEYQAAGRTRTGTTYDAAQSSTPTLNELEEEGVAARRGPSVCYVNPANPDESSYLKAGYMAGGAVLGFGLIFAGVGAMIMMAGIFSILRRVIGHDGGTTRTAQGCAGGILAPIFFALFAIAGFTVWKMALHNQPDWKAIGNRMVPVPAKVLASGVASSRSSGKNSSTTYKAKIAYEYTWDGRTWRSGWLDFSRGTTSSSNHSKARDAANRYPAGSTPNAWVDPAAPWQAVLEKESGTRWWLWLFPIIFGGIGVIGLAFWLLKLTALGAALFGSRSLGK